MINVHMVLSATEAEGTETETAETEVVANETEEVETPLDTTLPNAEVKLLGIVTVGDGEGIFGVKDYYIYDLLGNQDQDLAGYVAKIGEVGYTSVEDALDAAVEGDTVVLVADVADAGTLIVYSGVTLDLAGYTLETGHVAAFAGSDIIDSSEANSALLKVAKDCIMLAADNSQMPVWNAVDGYMFATVKMQAQMVENSTASVYRFQYRPRFSSNATFDGVKGMDNYLFADGTEDNDISITLRLVWDDSENNVKGLQEFTYSSEYVSQIYGDVSGALAFDLETQENTKIFRCLRPFLLSLA